MLSGGTGSDTFSIAFPHNAWGAVCTFTSVPGTDQVLGVSALSTTGLTVGSSAGGSALTLFYLAVGD
jgi:hypothetical protein